MIKVETEKDLNAELSKGKRVLAMFYSTWCPYCMRFVPVFNHNADNLKVDRIVHVIIDDYDNELWDSFDIGAVPTIILFEDGKICSRLDGQLGSGLNERQLKQWLVEIKLA